MKRFHERIAQKAQDFAAAPVLIIALGDSVTQGYTKANTIEPKHVYHQRLKEQLEVSYPLTTFSVINAGVAGSTAKDSLERLQRDVICHQPDLVVIGFGLNDAVQLGLKGLEQFSISLQSMIDRIRAETQSDLMLLTPNLMVTSDNPNIHPSERHYLEGLLPIQNDGILAAYVDVIRNLAIHNSISLVDVYQVWTDLAAKGTDTNTLLANGLNHPGVEAHKILADVLLQRIQHGANL